MPHALSEDQMQSLLATLQARMMVGCYGPGLRLIATELPGKAVCAVLRAAEDGVTRVIYDPSKPHALSHTGAMLRTWWTADDRQLIPPSLQPDSVEFLLSSSWRAGSVALENSDESTVRVRQ